MKTHKFADYKGDPWAEALAEQADDMKDDTFVEKARRDGYLIKSFTPYVSSEEGNDFVNDVVRSITPEDKEEILGQDEIAALMQGMNVYSKNTDKFRFVSIGINDSEGAELYEGDHLWCKYYVNNIDGTITFRRGVIRYQAPSFVVMVDSPEGLVPFNFNALFSFKKIQPVNF